MYVYTIQVSNMALQVVRSEPRTILREVLDERPIFQRQEIMIWPAGSGSLWPPPVALDETEFVSYGLRQGWLPIPDMSTTNLIQSVVPRHFPLDETWKRRRS
jgi:hypothetical protein